MAKLNAGDVDSVALVSVSGRPAGAEGGASIGSAEVSHEVPRQQRRVWTLAEYRLRARDRNDAIRQAYASGTFSLREIGVYFGLHYSSVSHIVRGDVRRPKPELTRMEPDEGA